MPGSREEKVKFSTITVHLEQFTFATAASSRADDLKAAEQTI